MATTVVYRCTNCDTAANAGSMLEALNEVVNKKIERCRLCESPREVELAFAFAFGATGNRVVVRTAFIPRRPLSSLRFWPSNSSQIEFRPFLVVLEDATTRGLRSIWLPYWHIVSGRPKYGQWAPLMDEELFVDLVAQAAAAGYVKSGVFGTV